MSAFGIKTIIYNDEPCIEVNGNCNQDRLDVLLKAFQKTIPKTREKLYLDMSNLTYLDSASLGVIMFNFNSLARDKKHLIVINPSEEMRHLMHITALDRVLPVETV